MHFIEYFLSLVVIKGLARERADDTLLLVARGGLVIAFSSLAGGDVESSGWIRSFSIASKIRLWVCSVTLIS